jgi:hypothetical protein
MARSMARPAFSHEDVSRFSLRKPENIDDFWPEEPTAVDAAMTMEEMIVEEIRRQGAMPPPANDGGKTAKKGTLAG